MSSSGKSPNQPSPDTSASFQPKHRAQRVSRACDFCHARSIRCRPGEDGAASCKTCVEYQRECTYHRPSKKRGVKPSSDRYADASSSTPFGIPFDPGVSSEVRGLFDQDTLFRLAETYFETIYPSFPLFHPQTLYRRIEAGEYCSSRPCLASLISLSALTIARIRDFASYSEAWEESEIKALPATEDLVNAAQTMVPKDPQSSENFDYLRCSALLALTGLQIGKVKNFHFWFGIYHMLSRLDNLQSEASWPIGISRVEVEERRRLFWSMYTLEIFSAACFDTPLSSRGEHNRVSYPTTINDRKLDDIASRDDSEPEASGAVMSVDGSHSGRLNWLQGWNFVTDLYRILEHAIDERRNKDAGSYSTIAAHLFRGQGLSPDHILPTIMQQYNALPQAFKEMQEIKFNQDDIYGFQATNIMATIQLVRMVLLTHETVRDEQRCTIIQEVVHMFRAVPLGYLKAMSVPLFIQLGAIGHMLGSNLKLPLPDSTFNVAQTNLLQLADLLADLGKITLVGDEPAKRIIAQLERMEASQKSQRQTFTTLKSSLYTPEHSFSPTSNTALPPSAPGPAIATLPSPPPSTLVADSKVGASGLLHRHHTQATEPFGAQPSHVTPQSVSENTSGQFAFTEGMLEDWSWAFDFSSVS